MTNILHVINIYFSLSYFGNQFKYFSGKGYNQHIICSPSNHLDNYSKLQQINYYELPIKREISPVQDLLTIYKICRYIKNNNIKIVIGHTPKGALLAMLSSFIMRTPKRVYYRHGLVYETMTGFKRRLMINIDRLTALCATQIICVSPSLYKRSLEDHLNSESKQMVLGKGTCGGIDAIGKFNPEIISKEKIYRLRKMFQINKDTFTIGYCGRFAKDKGIEDLINAFLLLKNTTINKHIKLLLIGDFDERDALSQETYNVIKDNADIIHTGFVFKDIEYYYSLMDIFMLPSYREGFGMVVLEASAMEIPVLTTKVTGCIDSIIEGLSGYYVSNSPESIYEGIIKLMTDPALKEYGKNGRNLVLNHFDNHIIWPIIEEEVYNSKNHMRLYTKF